MSLDLYIKILRSRLSEQRFNHCLNVAKEAKKLAIKYDSDSEKAEIAGILHDITKETPKQDQLELIGRVGVELSEAERSSFKLWHAVSGYAYARLELKIEDEDILNAIRYHTSGRSNMSKLEKIVFVADFISEDRKYKTVGKIRYVAYVSLDEAVINGIEYTVKSLIKKRSVLDPRGIEAYNGILFDNGAKTIDD